MKPVQVFLSWKLWVSVMLLAVGFIVFSGATIRSASEGRLFTDPAHVPRCEVALVLGCRPTLANGRKNLYFEYRIAAVKELWEAGRINQLLVSGDNSRKDYDEPTEMKRALIASGIPAERIHCDFAGFRTLDSVVRAREIFGQERFVVVSQPFHVERALYLAVHSGIEAYGYPARDVEGTGGLRTKAREQLARVKAVLDVKVLRTRPKLLGEPEPIAGP